MSDVFGWVKRNFRRMNDKDKMKTYYEMKNSVSFMERELNKKGLIENVN